MDINTVLSRPATEFENDKTLEELWATKAFEHSEIYFDLLCSVDPKFLKLSSCDDDIYNIFRVQFPNMDVKVIKEEDLKSEEIKPIWRLYCELFKNSVENYNFGTLLRIDSGSEYSESNTILVTRIQFLSIELARNREGHNDEIRKKYRGQIKTAEKSD